MLDRLPKPISPRMHRIFDFVALPGMIATVAFLAHRKQTRAAGILAVAAGIEGAALLTTRFPPGILPWLSFRDHTRIGLSAPLYIAALTYLFDDVTPAERRTVFRAMVLPMLVNGLSDTRR